MKANKFTYLMAMALTVTVVATGCKTKPVGLTTLQGRRTGVGDGIGNGNPLDTKGGARDLLGGGPISTATTWNPEDFNGDRAALAAHTVHFDYDSYVVKSSEQSHVQAVASALGSDNSAKLMIEGHCDERGTEEYNRALGERRALALREALATLGVDPERVRTLSFGEDKPVAQGQDESAYRQNRRGEFILMRPK